MKDVANESFFTYANDIVMCMQQIGRNALPVSEWTRILDHRHEVPAVGCRPSVGPPLRFANLRQVQRFAHQIRKERQWRTAESCDLRKPPGWVCVVEEP